MTDIMLLKAIKRLKEDVENVSKQPGPQGEKGENGARGERGERGEKGERGQDGYTPQKNIDYFDGKDGRNGKDGYTPQKDIDYFDGKDGKDGQDGKNGADGVGIKDVKLKNGVLTVYLTDGQEIKCGKIAMPYVGGGISVTNCQIKNNHLFVMLSNGREIDCGAVGGGQGGGNVNDVIVNGESVLEGDRAIIDLTPYAKAEDIPNEISIYHCKFNPDWTYNSGDVTFWDVANDKANGKESIIIGDYSGLEVVLRLHEQKHNPYVTPEDNYFTFYGWYRVGAPGDDINMLLLHIGHDGNVVTPTHSDLRGIETRFNKTNVWTETPNDSRYPTEKLVKDTIECYVKKPVELFNKNDGLLIDGTLNEAMFVQGSGLTPVQTTSQTVDADKWNITGANFKPYKSLKVVYVRDEKNAGTTAEFRIPLEYPIKSNAYFSATGHSLTFGDRNRFNICQCVVNASGYAEGIQAKSQFCFLNGASLYGTAYSPVSSIYIVKIYGCYD